MPAISGRTVAEQIPFLLIEEYFATGDDRFVDALRGFHIPGSLATIADKWKADPRPWARQQILRYLDLHLNAPAHETVVKRLFKHAEDKNDDELMAAFAVAFDRLVRHLRKNRWRYDWNTRRSWTEEVLVSPRNKLPTPNPRAKQGPVKPQWTYPYRTKPGQVLFSRHTRYYLRRRAWRYFRRIAFRRPNDYPAAVARMLIRYRDEDVARGENILDNWSLMHACFRHSGVLEFGTSKVNVKEGHALRELSPAPQFAELWQRADSARVLFGQVLEAQSRLVRVWAMQVLRGNHAEWLRHVSADDVLRLLDHADEEIQLFGAQVLENWADLDKLPVATWLKLLETRNMTALETIARLMSAHVHGERLDLSQCVLLTCAKPAPVARLGFAFLRDREVRSDSDRQLIAGLAGARCPAVGEEVARWALERLGAADVYEVDRVARFFDGLLREVREGAWSWLKPNTRGWDDAALWSRLVETPYDDVRLHFVSALQQRAARPHLEPAQLAGLWSAVLLGIHRGGRHKLIALRQISDAVRARPEAAEILLPVLAVAIRSVRAPEARAGLAAIVATVEARPELTPLVSRALPELTLTPQEAA